MIAADLDRRLLERSRELAYQTKAFDPKKLPKTLRVAMDSSPLEGAGRVEDTINLLGHAGRKIVTCAAQLLGWTEERVCREADCPLLLASSIKAGLDLDWSDPDEKASAVPTVIEQLTSLEQWVTVRLPDELDYAEHSRVRGMQPLRSSVCSPRRSLAASPTVRHEAALGTTRAYRGYLRQDARTQTGTR